MAEPNPFEMYVQEFGLRLKLIETIGKWNKDMAEAEVKWAEARLTYAKAATIERINRELQIALQELKREERRAKDRLSKAENDAGKAKLFVTARRITNPIVFAQSWAAFDWFLGEADTKAARTVIKLPVDRSHRSKQNFVAILTTRGDVTDATEDITNFGLLKAWMQSNYYFFGSGTPVHDLVLEAMDVIRASRAAVVEELERRITRARNQSFEKLNELRTFLGLPQSAEKTPSVPAKG